MHHCDCTRRPHGLYRFLFFFNDTATTEIYTLSLHDALPIYGVHVPAGWASRSAIAQIAAGWCPSPRWLARTAMFSDRKSTRLNYSHANISYAVFCLKKKTKRKYDASREPGRM